MNDDWWVASGLVAFAFTAAWLITAYGDRVSEREWRKHEELGKQQRAERLVELEKLKSNELETDDPGEVGAGS